MKSKKIKKTTKKPPVMDAQSIIDKKQQEQWQGEDDARILAQAKAILADKKRVQVAKKHARIMITKQQKELQNLKKIVN